MPKLYSTLGRAALVALGLAVAPAAFAQITCSKGMTPLVTGVGGPSAEAVCALSCNGGDVVAVDGQGNYVCQAPGGGPVAPAGCKITANPTSGGPNAANVGLTLSCTSGTLPINVAWSGGSAPGNCPSSMDALSKSCTVSSVSQTTTWTVSQFSNSAGNGSGNSNKSATYTYNPGGGGGGFQNCPSGSITDSSWYPHLNPGQPYEPDVGVFNSNGQIMSIKMTVPAGASGNKSGFFSAVNGGYKISTWAVSKTACDFDSPLVDVPNSNFAKNKIKYLKAQTSSNISFSYSQGAGPEGVAGGVTMVAGQTYYLNIRLDSCDVIGQGCYYGGSYLQ